MPVAEGKPQAVLPRRTPEHRQGVRIACLEEIALRMGFIEPPQLNSLVERLPKGDYRDYLQRVAQEGAA